MKFAKKAMAAVAACALLSSCMTVSHPVTATTQPLGTKCGEATSYIYLGTWSSKGAENGINKTAKETGITKISHVDSYTTNYVWGLLRSRLPRFTASNGEI